MKTIYFCAALLLCSTLSFGQAFDLQFDHTNVLTDDLETSYTFYKEVLMLEELPTPWGQSQPVRFFKVGATSQIHVAQVEHQKHEMHKGLHIALTVKNFDAFLEHLTANGIAYSNFDGQVGTNELRPDGVRQIYFQDPDGYWLEVNDATY